MYHIGYTVPRWKKTQIIARKIKRKIMRWFQTLWVSFERFPILLFKALLSHWTAVVKMRYHLFLFAFRFLFLFAFHFFFLFVFHMRHRDRFVSEPRFVEGDRHSHDGAAASDRFQDGASLVVEDRRWEVEGPHSVSNSILQNQST